jgi:hypothetical protein
LALKPTLDGAGSGNYRLPTGNYPLAVKGYLSYLDTISILQVPSSVVDLNDPKSPQECRAVQLTVINQMSVAAVNSIIIS